MYRYGPSALAIAGSTSRSTKAAEASRIAPATVEDHGYLTVSDIGLYVRCPRLPYHLRVTRALPSGSWELHEWKSEQVLALENVENWVARLDSLPVLRALGQHDGVWVAGATWYSPGLGLAGAAELVLLSRRAVVPVRFCLAPAPDGEGAHATHRMTVAAQARLQLAALAMLAGEQLGRPAPCGVACWLPEGRVDIVRVRDSHRKAVMRVVRVLRGALREQRCPPARHPPERCQSCPFLRLCPDIERPGRLVFAS